MPTSQKTSPLILQTRKNNIKRIDKEFKLAITPKRELSTSEWAEEYRYLSPEDCAAPGKFSHDGFEYLKGFEDAFDDPDVRQITAIKSAQTAFTTAVLNMIGKSIMFQPGPWLVAYPTDTAVKKFSKKKLDPMIRDCKELSELVGDPKKRDGTNSMNDKEFPGMFITMVGLGTANNAASQSIRFLFVDEADRIPMEVNNEGDLGEVLEKRTAGFRDNCKIINVSTPTVKHLSRIDKKFEESDQRFFYMPCPFCKDLITYQFRNMKWDHDKEKNVVSNVRYECPKCLNEITENKKAWMVRNGEWIPTYPERKHHAGFSINEMYSPLSTWQSIAENFVKSKDDILKLKSFVNLVLGEVWEDQTLKNIDTNEIMLRCENYGPTLPEGVGVLTAGVDVQDNRLECIVKGWGLYGESWLIDYQIFHGDPSDITVWGLLDLYLQKLYKHQYGVQLLISAVCVDVLGHHTQKVYEFCSRREARRIYAIHGKAGEGLPVINVGKKTEYKGKTYTSFTVGTDTAKEMIYSRLAILDIGAGYMHFPQQLKIDIATGKGEQLPKEYFEQLTSEKLVTVYDKGIPKRIWKKTRARNEALDLEVYAYAAFLSLGIDDDMLLRNLALIKQNGEQQQQPPAQKVVENKKPSYVKRGL